MLLFLFFMLLLSRFSRVQLCATPQTAAHQAPPSLGFSRQQHWSGLPFPSPMHENEKWRRVVSDSSRPHGLQPTRLLRPWDFPGKSTRVGCHCKTGKETQIYRTVLWTLWERERVGRFGRMALKHVYYHVWNELPVQVRCMILDAWGWCTGTTQRDGMGREEGGGFRMGNTCIPVADSFWYLAKLIQLCKV